jgi:hypothetical protein
MLSHLREWWRGGAPLTAHLSAWVEGRSPKWPAVSRAYLAKHPTCAATGTREGVVAHHIVPVSVDPARELDSNNLLTLSQTNGSHLCLGHYGNYRRYNRKVRQDAARMLAAVNEFIHEHPLPITER